MNKTELNKQEKIALIIYFIALGYLSIVGYHKPSSRDLIGIINFILIFFISFSIHTTPLGISFRKRWFSFLWFLFSFILFLIPFWHYKSLIMLLNRSSFPYMLPLYGFFYYHIIRALYILFLKREPITYWIKYPYVEFNKELSRYSDGYDKAFTVVSFFGFMIILVQAIK
jgi:hypothetical protein